MSPLLSEGVAHGAWVMPLVPCYRGLGNSGALLGWFIVSVAVLVQSPLGMQVVWGLGQHSPVSRVQDQRLSSSGSVPSSVDQLLSCMRPFWSVHSRGVAVSQCVYA